MTIDLKAGFSGTYEFSLLHPDGSSESLVTHNIATHNFIGAYGTTLRFGSGEGEPSFMDNDVFAFKWEVKADRIRPLTLIEPDTAQVVLEYTVPALSSYTGSVTEVGLGGAGRIWTHALLRDAEGKPISIEKTENDILKVVVTLELTFASTASLILHLERFYKRPVEPNFAAILLATPIGQAGKIISGSSGNGITYYMFFYPYNSLAPLRGSVTVRSGYNELETGLEPKYLRLASDASTGQYKLTGNMRCKNDYFNTHYYRYIQGFMQAGYGSGHNNWEAAYPIAFGLDLCDPAVFPPQPMNDIALMTGDGVTQDIACPLNYFQAETEEIFVDGAPLTRGVDYTIDNMSNKDCWQELMHLPYKERDKITILGDPTDSGNGNAVPHFLADRFKSRYSGVTFDMTQCCTGFSAEHPLHFDWAEDHTCDCLKGRMITSGGCTTAFVEYSTNDREWLVAKTIENVESTMDLNETWPSISARYWRVRLDKGSAYFHKDYTQYLGHTKAKGIHFVKAPLEGAVVTMNCKTDVPLKSANFAFNLAFNLNIMVS